jgi:uncharacterized membrane protein
LHTRLSAHLILAAFALVLSLAVLTTSASASLDVCNESKSRVGVALGYYDSDTWVSEGWWHLDGGQCAPIIENDLNARYYYLFAIDFDAGGGWSGYSTLCVAPGAFTIPGRTGCEARGHHTAGFMEVDTHNSPNWIVRLEEADRKRNPGPDLSNLMQGAR